MLRNSSETFISQSTSRKFLDTLEDLLTSSRTSPVVRERVMDVLAAAAYASGSKKDAGFRGLWRRVKPRDKPEEGMPFDTEDAMFNPPLTQPPRAPSTYDSYEYDPSSTNPMVMYQDATPTVPDTPDTPPVGRPPPRKGKSGDGHEPGKAHDSAKRDREHDSSKRDREHDKRDRDHDKRNRDRDRTRHPHIIPPDEDMRRLFQECKIGVGNANLLSQALAMATPEELGDGVIKEFHKKCLDSQELIFTQIPWASAGAERSRAAKDQEERELRTRKTSGHTLNSVTPNGVPAHTLNSGSNGSIADLDAPTTTREEELLADLLAANEQLLEALKLYDDLKRVALEREVEDRSRGETRLDPRLRQYITEDGTLHPDMVGMGAGGSPSRSRSPSPARVPVPVQQPHPLPVPLPLPLPSQHQHSQQTQLEHAYGHPQQPQTQTQTQLEHAYGHPHPQTQQQQQTQTLAPPPAPPHGPRFPGSGMGGGAGGASRTPSPAHADPAAEGVGVGVMTNGVGVRVRGEYAGRGSIDEEAYRDGRERETTTYGSDEDDDGAELDLERYRPSAKALGKRKVEVDVYDVGGREWFFLFCFFVSSPSPLPYIS
ncbi:hypothetical protein B0H12DRAFT_72370 [Mycena haematopus]|nr:hypothetical protein B0H12DRAFT_72370 [Mycena haematopus]